MAEKISEIRKQVENALAFSKNPLAFLQKDAEENEHFSHFKVGPVRYVHVFEPELIKHIFHTNYLNYTKDKENNDFRTILGNGLLMNDSTNWQQQRKLIQPLIQPKYSALYSEQIIKCTNETLNKWKNKGSIDLYSEMNQLSFAIISNALFGFNLNDRPLKVKEAIHELIERLFYSTQTVFKKTDEAQNKKLIESKKILDNLIFETIAERKNKLTQTTDLLSMLIESKYDDGSKMSDQLMRDELVTLLFAGADTTASALAFLFYELAKQTEIKNKLIQELKNKSNPTLPIQLIHEVLRLYPPGWLIARIAVNDDAISDLKIKKGDTILVSPFVMHRSKRFWNEPESFIPERFEGHDKITKYSYIPFSSGPKTCVGNNFAITTLQTVLELVMEKFDLTLANDQQLEFEAGLTLRPKNKIELKLKQN